MEEKKEFRHIVAGIAFQAPAELKISASGERLNDYETHFNELYFDNISKNMTHKNWGVQFAQNDIMIPQFAVDIFVNDRQEFDTIHFIIVDKLPNGIELEMMQPYYGFEKFLELTKQQPPL